MDDKLLLFKIRNIDRHNTIPIVTLVDKLKNKYPEYRRHKTEKLTKMIRKAFASKGKTEPSRSFDVGDDLDTDENSAMSVKKMFESNHLKRRRVKLEERDINRVLDLDDEDEEPKIDLMKEMLRIRYSKAKNNLMKEGNIDTLVKTENLTRMIHKALASKGKTEPSLYFDVGDDLDTDEDSAMLVKKMFESNHLKRRRVKLDKEEKDITRVLDSDDEDEEPKIDLMKELLRRRYSKPNYNLMKEDYINTPVKSVKPSPKKLKSSVNDGGVDGNVKWNEVVPRFMDLGGMGDEDEERLIKEILRIRYSKLKNNLTKEGNIDTPVKSLKPSPKKLKSLVNDGGVDGNVKGNEVGPMFKDLGGMDDVLEELIREVIVPLYYPELPRGLGLKPVTGILLHGPPGCGKTTLADAIANETGLPSYKISAAELVSGITGASEENIRKLFTEAYRAAPSIVFIDEIDAIASKRENLQREMERRIVTQLMTCMDESHRVGKPDDPKNTDSTDAKLGYVLVIGATNRPDAIDQALRRPGRFDREIALGVPNENARIKILTVLTRNLKLEGALDLVKIARSTPGFVGADLEALVTKAGNLALNRIVYGRKVEVSIENADSEANIAWWKKLTWSPEVMEKLSIAMSDFEMAAKLVQPSTKREGFSSIPDVKWEDVGGLDSLRKEFECCIVERIKYPDEYEEDGADLETGFLLYGPPGCGKTLIAKAVANEAGANFIYIKGPELLSKYVGESERAVRTIFSRARTCSPCILFFDEIDALTKKRGQEGGWVVERIVNQLLIELDGADQRKGVYIIGATNRPDVMDQALLRRGRLGTKLYVPLPNQDERGLILKAIVEKKQLDTDVDLVDFGKSNACANFSGSDLYALISEAASAAREERISKKKPAKAGMRRMIKAAHFDQALRKISPSVSEEQMQHYQQLQKRFR